MNLSEGIAQDCLSLTGWLWWI